ncbi:hypothetical protein ABT270_28560 [Streptomyces sp900105245]|uniref:hypothetical protein n=1 Tax=Streptomyces sp. 900105245 TaxID=3154379 RepID=UPI003325D81A
MRGHTHALDRALVVHSVDCDIGEPVLDDSTAPQLRQYTDEIENVRVLYLVTALRTVVVAAYVKVCQGSLNHARWD